MKSAWFLNWLTVDPSRDSITHGSGEHLSTEKISELLLSPNSTALGPGFHQLGM
jgi:hypothetical protein